METRSPKEIKKITDQMQKDMDKIGTQPRFGFFSIPYNSTIGDGFYSRDKVYNHKIVERKVISEKRGIFTTGLKTGKGPDVYFQLMDKVDEPTQQRLIEGEKEDKKKLKETVAARKNAKFVEPFKYPGAQSYKDHFDQNPVQRDFPLYKDPPKHFKVVEHKVIVEPRGVYTQPMKKGLYNTPGVLFSFTPLGYNKDDKFDFSLINKQKKKKRVNSAFPQQTAYARPFMPASLKRNECFSTNKEAFGYDNAYYQNLKNESEKERKSKHKKFQRRVPPHSAKHENPFRPASLVKQGRDGLFDQGVWNCPSIPEKRVIVNQREKKEYEAAHRKDPFLYNKLMDQTKFSPSVVTNTINMKRDFPTVYKF